ncbi:MAG: large subunit ribosomal protein [Patescibacteria group bacterium]|nr:large subunit ribosomal protein [Patescibacteria group bacterium]
MSVRMRHTRAHTGNRRSHHALTAVRLSKCVKCGELHLRHRACLSCGSYRGKEVVDVVAKAEKKAKKAKAKASGVAK